MLPFLVMKETDKIFGSLLFITQRWTVKGDAILKDKVGITTKQWMLLVILMNNFEGIQPTITETAKEFGTSRQNLKQVALSLQKKGFIDIKPDPNDFRIQRIALTGKHLPYFEGTDNESWQKNYINSLFKGFTNEELFSFSAYVDKLIENL
jgi:DNA-binding MarR family transcriptional regulator